MCILSSQGNLNILITAVSICMILLDSKTKVKKSHSVIRKPVELLGEAETYRTTLKLLELTGLISQLSQSPS